VEAVASRAVGASLTGVTSIDTVAVDWAPLGSRTRKLKASGPT
jgi:hypothetical protein